MVIRNYPNLLISAYLCFSPLFDLITMRDLNPTIIGIRISDIYLLILLCCAGLYFVVNGIKWMVREPFVFIGILFILYKIIVDMFAGVNYYMDFLPRMILNLVMFALATRANLERKYFVWLIFWNIVFYTVFSIPQLAVSLIGQGRVNSFYTIPNTLAFNTLHFIVLLAFLPQVRWISRITTVLSIILILMTKTRSVIISSLWFIKYIMKKWRIVAIITAIGVLIYISQSDILRISDLSNVMSLNGRIQIWKSIEQHFEAKDLFFGQGTGVDVRMEILPRWDPDTGKVVGFVRPQNHYLQLLIENGFIGLFLWCLRVFVYLRQIKKLPGDKVNQLVTSFVAALLSIQLMENEAFVSPCVMLIMGLALSHGRRLRRQLATQNAIAVTDDHSMKVLA